MKNKKRDAPNTKETEYPIAASVPEWAWPGLTRLRTDKRPAEKNYLQEAAARYEDYANESYDPRPRLAMLQEALEDGKNVGIVPCRGLIIIDADCEASVEYFEPMMTPNTPTQMRPNTVGKKHWYVRIDEDTHKYFRKKNHNLKGEGKPLFPGNDPEATLHKFDLITHGGNIGTDDAPDHSGGQVVIPPSKHESGNHYQWVVRLPEKFEDIPLASESLMAFFDDYYNGSPDLSDKLRKRRIDLDSRLSTHQRLLNYSRTICSFESRSDPAAAKARCLASGYQFIREELFGKPDPTKPNESDAKRTERMRQEEKGWPNLLEKDWNRYGASHAFDESTGDLWLAKAISIHFGERWRAVVGKKSASGWIEWNEENWQRVSECEVAACVQEYCEVIRTMIAVEQSAEKRANLRKIEKALGQSKKISSVVMAIERSCFIREEMLDANPSLITFRSALGFPAVTLNLDTGEARPPDPNDLITKIAYCAYAPGHTHPSVERWWSSSFPDEADRASVEELAGVSMRGRSSQERIVALIGDQGSGKGTLGFSLTKALGDYGLPIEPSMIHGKGSLEPSRKDFSLVNLKGVRVAYCDEFGGVLGDKAKNLAQGGERTGPVKFGIDVRFDITASIWLSANTSSRPRVSDPQGFERRLIEVPMNAGSTVKGLGDFDWKLKDTLLYDLSARTAMMGRFIEGLNRARENDFNPVLSPNIKVASEAWIKEADKIGPWINDACELWGASENEEKETWFIDSAFTKCIHWYGESEMDRRDFARPTKDEFGHLMKRRGLEKIEVAAGVRWVGVRIKSEVKRTVRVVDGKGQVHGFPKRTMDVK